MCEFTYEGEKIVYKVGDILAIPVYSQGLGDELLMTSEDYYFFDPRVFGKEVLKFSHTNSRSFERLLSKHKSDPPRTRPFISGWRIVKILFITDHLILSILEWKRQRVDLPLSLILYPVIPNINVGAYDELLEGPMEIITAKVPDFFNLIVHQIGAFMIPGWKQYLMYWAKKYGEGGKGEGWEKIYPRVDSTPAIGNNNTLLGWLWLYLQRNESYKPSEACPAEEFYSYFKGKPDFNPEKQTCLWTLTMNQRYEKMLMEMGIPRSKYTPEIRAIRIHLWGHSGWKGEWYSVSGYGKINYDWQDPEKIPIEKPIEKPNPRLESRPTKSCIIL